MSTQAAPAAKPVKKRNLTVDIARGIAICSVVLGHQGIETANRLMFGFNLVIFYLISGFFINEKEDFKTFLKKRARSLLVPYVVTSLITIVVAFLQAYFASGMGQALMDARSWFLAALYGAGNEWFYPFHIRPIGALWFLWAMFWALVFVKLALKMNVWARMPFFLILWCFGYYTRYQLWLPFSIQAGACDALFVYFGYLGKDLLKLYRKFDIRVKYFLFGLVAFLWAGFSWDYDAFGVVNNTFNRGFEDFIIAVLSCILIFELSAFIEKYFPLITRWLCFLGKYSIVLLCIHILELNLYDWTWYYLIPIIEPLRASIKLGILWVFKMIVFTLLVDLLIRFKFIRKIFALKA